MGKKKDKKPKKIGKAFISPFDVQGSWTGRYLLGEFEEPDQDADDL